MPARLPFWISLASFLAALAGFGVAAWAGLTRPAEPGTPALLWAGAALVALCALVLPATLFTLLHRQGIHGVARRMVLIRAVWGGPFGTLGAIWDLTGASGARGPERAGGV